MCAIQDYDPLSTPPPYKAQMEQEPEVEIKSSRWKAREMYFIADSDERVQGLLENVISSKKRESDDYTDLMAQVLRQRELACQWVDETGKFIEQLKETDLEIKEQAKQPGFVRLASDADEKRFAALFEQKRSLQKAMAETRRRCQEYYNQHHMRKRPDSTTLQQVAGALALPKAALEEYLQQDQASLPNMDHEAKIMKAICDNMDKEWEKVKLEMVALRQPRNMVSEGIAVATTWVISGVSWAWSNTPSLSQVFSRGVFPKEPVELRKSDEELPPLPQPSAPPLPFEGPVEVVSEGVGEVVGEVGSEGVGQVGSEVRSVGVGKN